MQPICRLLHFQGASARRTRTSTQAAVPKQAAIALPVLRMSLPDFLQCNTQLQCPWSCSLMLVKPTDTTIPCQPMLPDITTWKNVQAAPEVVSQWTCGNGTTPNRSNSSIKLSRKANENLALQRSTSVELGIRLPKPGGPQGNAGRTMQHFCHIFAKALCVRNVHAAWNMAIHVPQLCKHANRADQRSFGPVIPKGSGPADGSTKHRLLLSNHPVQL